MITYDEFLVRNENSATLDSERSCLRAPPGGQPAASAYSPSALFLVANVGLMTYLVVSFLSSAYGDPPDFMRIPIWLIFAMDHAMFIGVMTNGLFGVIYEITGKRRHFWRWADHLLFWGMNLGFVGFAAGLVQ